MASPPVLFLKNIRLTFGATPLLTGADLTVGEGDRITLVGRNGSGKSTLLKIAAGLVEADDGERFFQPGKTVRYLRQEPDLSAFATTLEYVESGLAPGDDHYRALYLLNELGMTGNEPTSSLSGGEIRRAALAHVLAPEPDILLLDEPTNHLDLPAIEWLESELKGMKSALVLISHDRRFLENLSRTTVWLDRGVTRTLDRGFSHFEAWRDQVLEEEERELVKLDRKIEAEEHWMRYGVTARRKRNVRRVDLLADLRQAKREHRGPQGAVKMAAAEAEASSKLVVEAKSISKSFGDRPIVRDFSIRVARGDRIGIVGPNGAGKTTLLRLLTGDLAPDSGSVKLGLSLDMQTLEQKRDSLDPETTLADALTEGKGDWVVIGEEKRHVIGYMKDFLFSPEQARTPLSALSGGERGRVMLARALAKPSNMLVLDEPTNDLDLETLDLLEELLADYRGTIIVISHDRDFLDRVVASVVMSEGEGRWLEYAGGYTDMLAQRGKGVEARKAEKSAAQPKREAAPAAAQAPKSRSKLSFKDKHALETLPGRIESLSEEAKRLHAVLDDASLYARDPKLFASTTEKLTATEAALAAAEEEWLRLEMLREELEG
ncbi:elongation factor 3 [Pleomorphomonas diazotrophica]|uniref:Elongation factor 3 n=1 Tax=Pleomorphomonas diazotrophica TaxID=1166257 RepID=A0A1I4RK39_9HYPH|nr:ATP-binding cassette domain-containing protein [Pleomorphomonas diazotrophica]PKR87517.1 elongation factor 3 [Pleomorphomonas diazotrophica]SFM52615.1 ATP-binding cassette, subfamily F, uup [Pleomorphomonas diazotrophica]